MSSGCTAGTWWLTLIPTWEVLTVSIVFFDDTQISSPTFSKRQTREQHDVKMFQELIWLPVNIQRPKCRSGNVMDITAHQCLCSPSSYWLLEPRGSHHHPRCWRLLATAPRLCGELVTKFPLELKWHLLHLTNLTLQVIHTLKHTAVASFEHLISRMMRATVGCPRKTSVSR